MVFAHAVHDAGGPEIEYLVTAGALLVLGILLYIQKSTPPVVSVALALVAVALGSGAFFVGESPAAEGRSIVITSPAPNDTVPADKPIPIEFALHGAELASSPTSKDGGHLHVLVDGFVQDMPFRDPEVEFDRGVHTLTLEFVDADHRPYRPPVKDEIEVTAR